jgi:hypothetical protein
VDAMRRMNGYILWKELYVAQILAIALLLESFKEKRSSGYLRELLAVCADSKRE